jgi:hypothetical protein
MGTCCCLLGPQAKRTAAQPSVLSWGCKVREAVSLVSTLASASNDSGELSKLALHAHYCPLRPLIAMHRVKRQDHAHVASYLKEVHLVAYVVWLNAGNEIGPVGVGDRLARNDLGVGWPTIPSWRPACPI